MNLLQMETGRTSLDSYQKSASKFSRLGMNSNSPHSIGRDSKLAKRRLNEASWLNNLNKDFSVNELGIPAKLQRMLDREPTSDLAQAKQ